MKKYGKIKICKKGLLRGDNMLTTTPRRFIWIVQKSWLYCAETPEEVKYTVTLNRELLGGFMGINRSFDDDYYVNYVDNKGKCGSWYTHRDSEMILVEK